MSQKSIHDEFNQDDQVQLEFVDGTSVIGKILSISEHYLKIIVDATFLERYYFWSISNIKSITVLKRAEKPIETNGERLSLSEIKRLLGVRGVGGTYYVGLKTSQNVLQKCYYAGEHGSSFKFADEAGRVTIVSANNLSELFLDLPVEKCQLSVDHESFLKKNIEQGKTTFYVQWGMMTMPETFQKLIIKNSSCAIQFNPLDKIYVALEQEKKPVEPAKTENSNVERLRTFLNIYKNTKDYYVTFKNAPNRAKKLQFSKLAGNIIYFIEDNKPGIVNVWQLNEINQLWIDSDLRISAHQACVSSFITNRFNMGDRIFWVQLQPASHYERFEIRDPVELDAFEIYSVFNVR